MPATDRRLTTVDDVSVSPKEPHLHAPQVALVVPDINGVIYGKYVNRTILDLSQPNKLVPFGDYRFIADPSGQPIPKPSNWLGEWPGWDAGFGDVLLAPDTRSARPAPWLPSVEV